MKIAMNAAMTPTSLRTLYGAAWDGDLVASAMFLLLRFARTGFRREEGWI